MSRNLNLEFPSTAIPNVARCRAAPPSAACFAVREGDSANAGGQGSGRHEWVVEDLGEFVGKVANFLFKPPNDPMPKIRGRADEDMPVILWRGQLCEDRLIPSAFRKTEPSSQVAAKVAAKVAAERARMFKDAAPAIYAKCPGENEHFKWLTLMQHHGLPTCLLDWSDSPLVALFFALGHETFESDKDRVVWGLNLGELNNVNVRSFFNSRTAVRPEHSIPAEMAESFFKGNISSPTASPMGAHVLAVSAPYLDYQQMMQQSRYTIHGNHIPLEESRMASKILPVRIVIRAEHRETMRIHLLEMGIRRRYLFPNLRGLAEGVREESVSWRRGL